MSVYIIAVEINGVSSDSQVEGQRWRRMDEGMYALRTVRSHVTSGYVPMRELWRASAQWGRLFT
jgi:hypothetical protein